MGCKRERARDDDGDGTRQKSSSSSSSLLKATTTKTERGRRRRRGSLDLSGNDDEEENESDEKQQQTQDDLDSSEKRLEELSTTLRKRYAKDINRKGKIYETAMTGALIVTSKSSEQRKELERGAKWERSRHSVGDVDEVGVGSSGER